MHGVATRHQKSIVKIAKEAGYDQSTFYVHVKREDLPFEILYKYSKVLSHDFSKESPEMEEYLAVNGLKTGSETVLTYEELLRDRDNWRDKYYAQLEENSRLIKEKYNR